MASGPGRGPGQTLPPTSPVGPSPPCPVPLASRDAVLATPLESPAPRGPAPDLHHPLPSAGPLPQDGDLLSYTWDTGEGRFQRGPWPPCGP